MSTIKVSFKLDAREMFRKMGNTRFMRAARRWGRKTGASLEHRAKMNVQNIVAPSGHSYKTGGLSGNISFRVIEEHANVIARVGSSKKYAAYVEFGTGIHGPRGQPYAIAPTKKKALAWNIGRRKRKGAHGDVVVRYVRMHPGMKGKRYLSKALTQEFPEAGRRLDAEMRAEMERA